MKYLPYAFTEHGTLMVSSILKGEVATKVNQTIIRVFVELRSQSASLQKYENLFEKIKHLDTKIDSVISHNLVDKSVITTKITKLSQDIRQCSEILDQFQAAHIVIKRPGGEWPQN